MKICFVLTDPINLHSLYRDQFSFLSSKGVSITAIASPGKEHEWIKEQGAISVPIRIARNPELFGDLVSLFKVWWFFLFNRFDLVVVSTPKASLIGALAARLSFQRRLIFMIRGRAYENMRGLKRSFFRMLDKVVCKLSSRVQSISKELAEKYIDEGICRKSKMVVLGLGSSNGVDLNKFDPNLFYSSRNEIKKELSINDSSFVFLFCGRVRRDKGINELVSAFRKFLEIENEDATLLIVGQYEDFDPIDIEVKNFIQESQNVKFISWARHVEPYFSIADVFVFPSYREGFGNVALEASAMKLPVIAFDVIGCREAVEKNKSGLLVELYDENGLFEAMVELYRNDDLRICLGNYGRKRIECFFDSQSVWERLLNFYKNVADNR